MFNSYKRKKEKGKRTKTKLVINYWSHDLININNKCELNCVVKKIAKSFDFHTHAKTIKLNTNLHLLVKSILQRE